MTCAWCGRPKGAYGPRDYCTYMCAVEAKRVAAGYAHSRDQSLYGFSVVDAQGRRVDPGSISAASPRHREDQTDG